MSSRYISFLLNKDIVHLRAHVIRNCPGRQQDFRVHNWYNLKVNDTITFAMHRVVPEESITIELFYHYTIVLGGYLMMGIAPTTQNGQVPPASQ